MKRRSATLIANEMLCTGSTREQVVEATGLSRDYVRRLDVQRKKNLTSYVRVRVLDRELTDDYAKLAVKAWVLKNDMPVTPRRWTELQIPGGVTASALMSHFGSWTAAMRAAGIPYSRNKVR